MNGLTESQTLPQLVLANADFVTPYLAVGGDLSYDDDMAVRQSVELVVDGGITHVLDVRHEADDTQWWANTEVTFLWAGIDDAGQRIPAAWFERIVTWATDAIAEGGVVLTHCHMGINRGPSARFRRTPRHGDGTPSRRCRPSGRPARSRTSGTPRMR